LPLVQNLRFHDYQFEYSAPAGKWYWTTRVDVSQSTPSYQVRDIKSPYGLLRDSIPILGEVIQAMASSIVELRSNFAPSILIGPPTSLVFEVDEGRGYSSPQSVTLTNRGVFGSILGAGLAGSAPFVKVSPSVVGGLAVNEEGSFTVEVDSTGLLAVNSPYSESIIVQDSTATNNPQTLPVLINVRPKATIRTSSTLVLFNVARPLNGRYEQIPSQTFRVANIGPMGSVLEYDIRALTGLFGNWLKSFLPSEGTLQATESELITVTLQPPDGMLQGTYSEKLRIIGYSSNNYVDVEIRLVIT
jgi:hypothetical protein